jgi:hypothetical protein
MSEELGILIGVTKPDEVTFESRRPVSIGEYVILNYGGDKVLGLVERFATMKRLLRANRLRLRIVEIKVTRGMCAFLDMLMN